MNKLIPATLAVSAFLAVAAPAFAGETTLHAKTTTTVATPTATTTTTKATATTVTPSPVPPVTTATSITNPATGTTTTTVSTPTAAMVATPNGAVAVPPGGTVTTTNSTETTVTPTGQTPVTTATDEGEDATPEPEVTAPAVESFTMKDGTAIQVRGVQAVTVKADGTTTPAPDGEIMTADGKVMKVRGGVLIRDTNITGTASGTTSTPAPMHTDAPATTGHAPTE